MAEQLSMCQALACISSTSRENISKALVGVLHPGSRGLPDLSCANSNMNISDLTMAVMVQAHRWGVLDHLPLCKFEASVGYARP